MIRNPRYVVLLSLLFVCAAPLSQQAALADGGKGTVLVQPVAASGPLAGKAVYFRSFAIIIGINSYPNLPPESQLNYAVADATGLRDVLEKYYGFPPSNVTLLTDAQATRDNIENAINDMTDSDKVGPDDRLLVFFSGHGQTVATAHGGDLGFLIPEDAKVDLSNPGNIGPYNRSCISMTWLRDTLESCPAKHVLLLADACYSGLLAQVKSPEKLNTQVVAELMTMRARQVITAGTKGETSVELSEYGHGAFTYKLLEQLRARAATPGNIFTTNDLYNSLRDSVSNLTEGGQLPQLASFDTEGDFLFITTPPQSPPSATTINPVDGAEMIYIPPGPFLMGDDDAAHDFADNPPHTVTLSGYYIYKNDVTVAMYQKFCTATGRAMPDLTPQSNHGYAVSGDDHPIVDVSWNDAKAYCDWAGAQLPTDAQWEKAARGTDGRKYPWGDDWDASKLCCSKAKLRDAGGTAALGSFPAGASPYGVLDMAGNVWDWCADWYNADYWKTDEGPDPTGPSRGRWRVLRGGSWFSNNAVYFRSAYRNYNLPAGTFIGVGFRCVVRPGSP